MHPRESFDPGGSGTEPESSGRIVWPEAGGPAAARSDDGDGRRPGAGEDSDPDPAASSWLGKDRPAWPMSEERGLPEPATGPAGAAGSGDPKETRDARDASDFLADSLTRASADPFGSTGSTDPTGSDSLHVQVDDPWRTDGTGGTGGTREPHDPHEVTIQLDAVEPGGSSDASADFAAGKDADKPVFVDESGRRSRRLRRFGMAVGLACAAYAGVIVVTLLSGNAVAPWVPVPIPGVGDPPASKVKESPDPSESTGPPTGASGLPGAGVPGTGADADEDTDAGGPSSGAPPSPGDTAAPDASSRPDTTPGSSTRPQPSASSTKKSTPDRTTTPTDPGDNDSPPAGNPPSDPPSDPDPDPDPDPSDGSGGDSGGNGGDTTNNAGAAPDPSPLASEEPATDRPDATPDQSPENVL